MAVIIDDLGDRLLLDRRAVDLPVPLSCAILPHTPHARRVASDCAENGKEVMLHLPLQAKENNQLLGPGRLELDMDEATFRETFRRSLASVPGVRGVNNHMGSLLTRHPGAMAWLMEELREAGLFFIDSRTTPHSVAYDVAREHAVPAGRRDIFLDRSRDPAEIEAALDRAIRIAHQRGEVVVIGHPYPETLEVLEARLPWLETESGVELINASALLEGGDDPVLSEGASDEQASAGATGGRL
ncbi:divergent polysaccharide deacetylase family protein [Gammaproteobacteria bacterium AB-CW1]|uniref:Divergent polysaccharide deacetylase family protein n=1 Tax=Natronospira elongata TaxID=3110268 RepID=A0AAP6JHI9_9GAMM|nr:divergent polysaccharide deacetylase family protein [Gammaproteobacteria bacterium AB-CW1]